MTKKRNKIIAASIVICIVVLFASSYIYEVARFNPNRLPAKIDGMRENKELVEMLAKTFTPELATLEINYLDRSGMFQNRYSALGYVRRHRSDSDGYEQSEFVALCDDGKFDDGLERLPERGVEASWFEDVTEEKSVALWDSMRDGARYFAYFSVNDRFPLYVNCKELMEALTGSPEVPEEIEWAGADCRMHPWMLGTPLGVLSDWKYNTTAPLSYYASFFARYSDHTLMRWYFDSGIFGDFSDVDFKLLNTAYQNADVGAVMMFGTKEVLLKYKENPLVSLAFLRG